MTSSIDPSPQVPAEPALLRPALTLFLLLSLLTGLIYPLTVTGVARIAFADAAGGSLVLRDGKPVGSRLIGQSFTDPGHFWGRPSATATMAYNASSSGGSNLGPLNPALTDAVVARIAILRAADPGNTAALPVDLVTASASGLDPHISRAAAEFQINRVARARALDPAQLRALVDNQAEGAWLGFIGEARVNVLTLNLALEALARP